MAIIAKSRFLDLATDNAPEMQSKRSELVNQILLATDQRTNEFIAQRRYDNYGDFTGNIQGRPLIELNREAAEAMFDTAKQYVMANGYFTSKYFRPWEHDPTLYTNLDRSQAWWGFEFETGYGSREARSEVIEYVWDNFDGVCFDAEGEGNAESEITFTPQEVSKFEDGTAQAIKFIEYLDSVPHLIDTNPNRTGVGTHINISHPNMDTSEKQGFVRASLNNTIHVMSADERAANFGRSHVYAGWHLNSSGTNRWLEGKVFRTTYSAAVFAEYIKVSKAFTRCIDALLSVTEFPMTGEARAFVSNFEDVKNNNADPIIKRAAGFHGAASNGYINAGDTNPIIVGQEPVVDMTERNRIVALLRIPRTTACTVHVGCEQCDSEYAQQVNSAYAQYERDVANGNRAAL